ncbi:DUF6786 family protein [Dyadobacter tibetensis]|uniref:DUF6786 family protein n=1 Tax=Dyadobacter tibetensis TaxID=1211851 RepID=UPI00046FD1EA|nr:DUF6786 family protein [Dyadobacter tibetensis]
MTPSVHTFESDIQFLRKYQEVLLLQATDNPGAQVAVLPAFQGRVMTSTAGGSQGASYGWVNYDLIESGEKLPHMHAYGGEDRLWLSPEGGQYSIYFAPGAPFTFDHWQTPSVIDTEPFVTVNQGPHWAVFSKDTSLVNHSGTRFDLRIGREVRVLSREEAARYLQIGTLSDLEMVGYESVNSLTNLGEDWNRNTGALGIWILGMFQSSADATILVPFEGEPGQGLTTDYFGPIPAERLEVEGQTILLSADGKCRSKIGLRPGNATPFLGSYDTAAGRLTLVQCDLNPEGHYLKSTWEHHQDPYQGDVLNAYNDGPFEDGSQMGPFYELESSSSVQFLKHKESLSHIHRTYHFTGNTAKLDALAQQFLKISLAEL